MTKILPTRLLSLMVAALSILLLAGMFTPGARADEFNHETKVTFSGPVQVPGFHQTRVLPAGTYTFRLLNEARARDVVQILSADRSRLITTIMAVPNRRVTAMTETETVITFEERPAGAPPAIKAWFYPGEHYGHEFVYPKTEAVQLAKEVKEPVLSMPDVGASEFSKPATTAEAPAVKALESEPVMAEEPSGAEEPMSAVVETPQEGASSLPQTASEMPLAALGGIVLLGLGLGFRRLARDSK